MRLRIKATRLQLTPALRLRVRKKLFTPIRRMITEPDPAAPLMEVELARTDEHHRTGRVWRCEAMVTFGGKGLPLRAEATAESIEEAIARTKERIERVIKNALGRIRARERAGGQKVRREISAK